MNNIEYEAAAAAAAADDFVEEAAAAAENEAAAGPGISFDLLGFLRTPTGPGSVESYRDHPLNRNGSGGVAQVLRGCTGLFGALDLAVIDIMIGSFEVIRERKNGGADNASNEGE